MTARLHCDQRGKIRRILISLGKIVNCDPVAIKRSLTSSVSNQELNYMRLSCPHLTTLYL